MTSLFNNDYTFLDAIDWLRLARSPNVGPLTFYKLLERFGTAGAAIAALPDLARRGGSRRPVRICCVSDAEREIDAHARIGAMLITRDDRRYPPRLRHVADAPPVISVMGRIDLLGKCAVAVIGARNASLNGQLMAENLARDLGRGGLMVVSGLARGIDAAAHRGALPTGTLAVLGGGVDVIYPKENTRIYQAICNEGVLVSELPVSTRPKARHFPRRNRIISGISRGVVVVEAAPRSGSLITARLALEQGREVFAVPGAALDPRARGTNELIRQGATLTETAMDVLAEIGPDPGIRIRSLADGHDKPASRPPDGPDQTDTDQARQLIERWIGTTPTHVDAVLRQSELPFAVLNEALLELELAGRLNRHAGNLVSMHATLP